MASSLSSVPPVCPRPRPETIGTEHAAGRDQRREADRDLVADAAGGVLVDLRARGRRREIEDLARVEHRVRERDRLGVVMPRKNMAMSSALIW